LVLATLASGAAACLVSASGARASVTFGDSLGVPASTIVSYTCDHPCTLSTTTSPDRLSYFRAPISGMILRWRIQIGSSPAQHVSFRVLRRIGSQSGESFVGAGTSKPVALPTSGGTYAFATRLPVQAGDFIGLNLEGSPIAAVAVEEESIRVFSPPLADFSLARAGIPQDDALLLNADVAAPPSSELVSTCSKTGALRVRVQVDADPEVQARAVHFRIDRGRWKTVGVQGRSGVATIMVPTGSHALSYWGEDSLGQRERAHHATRVLVSNGGCPATGPGYRRLVAYVTRTGAGLDAVESRPRLAG
jgi:hypothetical protein